MSRRGRFCDAATDLLETQLGLTPSVGVRIQARDEQPPYGSDIHGGWRWWEIMDEGVHKWRATQRWERNSELWTRDAVLGCGRIV